MTKVYRKKYFRLIDDSHSGRHSAGCATAKIPLEIDLKGRRTEGWNAKVAAKVADRIPGVDEARCIHAPHHTPNDIEIVFDDDDF